MSEQPALTSYDDFPYPSYPLPQTHPDHLGAIATLLGLPPAPAGNCRILELGCASGGNLIPMALTLPGSSFMGIDLSGRQIAEGRDTIAALGLSNIQLRQMSILDVDKSFGSFDYIICHGVYSWVPSEVQDRILAICKQHLTPQGIGYLSYNTYPGWHMRGTIRAVMGLHDLRFRDQPPPTRVAQARALLAFLSSTIGSTTSYGQLLQEHLELLQKCTDSYIFHEHLEECNAPIYFTEMCDRLARRGLRYLGEAEFRVMVPATSFTPLVQKQLAELAPSLIEMEQYMDLLRNRMFRQTLIGHDHVQPSYNVRADQMHAFHVASPARPATGSVDLLADGPLEFKGRNDMVLTTTTPIVKAAFASLGEAWPGAIAFDALLADAQARLKAVCPNGQPGPAAGAPALGKALLTAYASAGEPLLELSLQPAVFARVAGDRPLASPLARLQAVSDAHVTNLRHEVVGLTKCARRLLPLLDGSRDRRALVEVLLEKLNQGELSLSDIGIPSAEESRAREACAAALDRQLAALAGQALLIS
jgi:methyltransferase-like protein/2-polyprenyl-3-methyl-5-hydroxy-6-metoxy-1,4-benzoquinol methylase